MADSSDLDLLQGTLDMLILQVVALGPMHGYAINQRIQQMSRDALQVLQGSLYPALHRLENRGLLAAEWRAAHRISEQARLEEREQNQRLVEGFGSTLTGFLSGFRKATDEVRPRGGDPT